MEMSWYIDAWAVRDGMAFASERAPNSIKEVQSTVFLSVPALEPVPIGRISTALRATRSGFQDKFHDLDGAEVPFQNLEQIQEIVRRAYLVSGGGPAGVGVNCAPRPDDDVDSGAGDAVPVLEEVDNLAHTLGTSAVWPEVVTTTVDAFKHPDDPALIEAIVRAVRAGAAATIERWENRLASRHGAAVGGTTVGGTATSAHLAGQAALNDWLLQLIRSGMWSDLELRLLVERGHPHLATALALWDSAPKPWGWPSYWDGGEQDKAFITGALASRVPHNDAGTLLAACPWPPFPGTAKGIAHLADMALASAVGYPASGSAAQQLVAMLLVGVAVSPRRVLVPSANPQDLLIENLRDAIQWVARETLTVELPEPAEVLMEAYCSAVFGASVGTIPSTNDSMGTP